VDKVISRNSKPENANPARMYDSVAGDTYNVVFRDEDGQPLRIPLAVYEALPEEHLVANQNAPS
jgi:hypothetical protein